MADKTLLDSGNPYFDGELIEKDFFLLLFSVFLSTARGV